jgi:hypothetical protein
VSKVPWQNGRPDRSPYQGSEVAAVVAFGGALGLVWILLWIGCFIDVLYTPEQKVRNLPKLAWLFVVLIFMLLGSIAWLVAGRPWDKRPVPAGRGENIPGTNRLSPLQKRANTGRQLAPDDDEEFLAQLRKRAEEQRRRAQEQQKKDDKPED